MAGYVLVLVSNLVDSELLHEGTRQGFLHFDASLLRPPPNAELVPLAEAVQRGACSEETMNMGTAGDYVLALDQGGQIQFPGHP